MSLYEGILYALAPPPGVVPNKDAPYHAANILGVIGVFLPITTAVMAIRIYTRVSLSGNFAFDDYLMTIAFVLGIIMIGFILDMLNWGLGKHMWDVPLYHLMPNWSFDNVMAAIMFCAATGFAKGSILLFYLRIFPTRNMRWAVWLAFSFVLGFSAASVLANIFSCNPVSGSWDPATSATAVCINRPVFYFAQAGLGIFADILTLVLPLPMLRTLQLPARQKVGVALVLTMGAFVCVVSIIRLQTLDVLMNDADLTRNTTSALAWCIVELLLSIIGGSIPALKPFVRRFFPGILGSTNARGRFSRGTGSKNYLGTGGRSRYGAGYGGGGGGYGFGSRAAARRSAMRPTPELILSTVSVKVTSCSATSDCYCGSCRSASSAAIPSPGLSPGSAAAFSTHRQRRVATAGGESDNESEDLMILTPTSRTSFGGGGVRRASTPLHSGSAGGGGRRFNLGHEYSISAARAGDGPGAGTGTPPQTPTVEGSEKKVWEGLR
ncbi:alpha-methylacyl-CoA racemase [Microdochium nivale]|nr:alpha-methylacyl-CoA racemase [Microdochium nivale]